MYVRIDSVSIELFIKCQQEMYFCIFSLCFNLYGLVTRSFYSEQFKYSTVIYVTYLV